MRKIDELNEKFYEIADNNNGLADVGNAYQLIDAMNAPISPDNYDETLMMRAEQALKNLHSAQFVDWANEIIEACKENSENRHDLRGMPKNTHRIA